MQQLPPLFSVVLLSWNRKEDTIAALESVYKALPDKDTLECIIVDQGSVDGSVERIEQYITEYPFREITLIKLPTNLGVPGGRNVGIARSRGTYLVFLDNDAELDVHAFENMKVIFGKDRSIGVISFLSINYFTRQIDETAWVYPSKMRSKAFEAFEAMTYMGGGHVIKKAVFDVIGTYDETLFFSNEEEDISFRAIDKGFKILYCPDIRIYHKVTSSHKFSWGTNRYYYFVRNRIYLCWKYLPLRAACQRSIVYFVGYFIKAIRNKTVFQYVKAVWGALSLFSKARSLRDPVSIETYRKIVAIEQYQRGSFMRRIKYELFAKKI